MPRHLSTAGPNHLADHYSIDPFTRTDWAEIEQVIDAKKFFILHAPRQSGETTSHQAMMASVAHDLR